VQDDAPSLLAILPASQAVHEFELAPVTDDDWPELHRTQLVDADAPVVFKYVPDGQSTQLLLPGMDWY
jgi:hypothetical protein